MRLFLALSIVLCTLSQSARAANLPYVYPASGPFWVATTGSDSTGDGSSGNPWATIQHARDYVRTNHLNLAQLADIIVNVRAGTYSLATSGPIVFGAQDSGFNGHSVAYVSSDRVTGDCKAHLSAGYTVSGWAVDSGTTYKASVPATFRSPPYENGIRSDWARSPNRSLTAGYPNSWSPYITTQSASNSLTALAYSTSDLTPGAWTLADVQLRVWSGAQFNWLLDTIQVLSVNTSTHLFTLTNQAKFYPYFAAGGFFGSAGGSRYFAQGDKSLLDVGGEAYLDRSGLTLYYIGRDGLAPSQTVIVPQQADLVQFTGTSGKDGGDRVSHIVLDGFCFENTDAPSISGYYSAGYADDLASGIVQFPATTPHAIDPNYGYFAEQPAFHVGAVHIKNADTITIENAHFQDIGGSAVFAEGYAINLTIQHSFFEKIGLSAIRFEGPYPGEALPQFGSVGNSTVYDVKVNSVGEMGGWASGIDMAQSGSNLIHYVSLANGPRKAIWIVGDTGIDPGLVRACGNAIDHIKVTSFCQDSWDTGAVTMSSLSSTASAVPFSCQNTVSQTIIDTAAAIPSLTGVSGAKPTGAMCDDTSNGQVWTNVNVTNSQGNNFRENGSSHHVLTNTSFNEDGTQNGSFNAGLMDTANIGTLGSCGSIAPPCFPY